MIYLENKFELDNIKGKSNSEKDTVSTALMMREKIKTLKDTVPWPPDVHDLDTSKTNIRLFGFVPEHTSIGVFYGK